MGKLIDLTGQRFGRLTVLSRAENRGKSVYWNCVCDCGSSVTVRASGLRRGTCQSCGCLHKERVALASSKANRTHGRSKTRLYHIWKGLFTRCYNPNSPAYAWYGGRGIGVCDAWSKDYMPFYEWSMASGYNDTLTIDRINNDEGYCPENCRWVDMKEQSRNKRSNVNIAYRGETKTLTEWAEELGISPSTLTMRLRRGWSIEKAFTQPVKRGANQWN